MQVRRLQKRGFIAILGAVGLLIILFGFTFVQNRILFRRFDSSALQLSESKAGLQQWIRTGLDCPKTLTLNPGPCPSTPISLGRKGSSAISLIESTGTSVGSLEVRATCTGVSPKIIQIEFRSIGKNQWQSLKLSPEISCS